MAKLKVERARSSVQPSVVHAAVILRKGWSCEGAARTPKGVTALGVVVGGSATIEVAVMVAAVLAGETTFDVTATAGDDVVVVGEEAVGTLDVDVEVVV